MEKAKKAEVVEELKGVFANAGSVVVAHYSGMTVAQMGDLRSRMRAAGASFKVAKNRLAVRALQGTAVEGISHLFKGPTGIAYSKDPIAASKVAVAYAKDNDETRDPGRFGRSDGTGCEGVKALASLPSLDELRGKIVGLLRGSGNEDRRDHSGARPVSLPASSARIPRKKRPRRRSNINIQTRKHLKELRNVEDRKAC